VAPSTVTWRSCIASSSAAWVLGGVRLISSASSRLVNTGPGRNSKLPLRWSKIDEPVTSEGIRSGVNWIRANPKNSNHNEWLSLRKQTRQQPMARNASWISWRRS
jgi:hypothetical protein